MMRADGLRMIIRATIAAAATVLAGAAISSAERTKIVLTDNWHIKQLDTDRPDVAELTRLAAEPDKTWMAARIPEQVHDVLIRHGKISDPRVGKNAAECTWVGEKDWAYACTFKSPRGNGGPILLCFDGLDTLAEAYLNGQHIGSFNNMYRQYAVDVKDKLAMAGKDNVLVIIFSSPLRAVHQVKELPHLKGVSKQHYLRKCHSDFGSYLGARPHSAKVGIFRDVYLDLPGRSWIKDIRVRPRLSADFNQATLHVEMELAGPKASLELVLRHPAKGMISVAKLPAAGGTVKFNMDVKNPRLWWPRTHGKQPLYQLEVTLADRSGRLDTRTVRFGIRDVKPVLSDPETGEKRFRFDVNGRPIFMQGADLAPLEGPTHCWNYKRAMTLLDLMEHGRMNVLRIWAEGNIPPQSFYDECDRRGIFIWQDFMFGYGMHPSGIPEFDENCRLEIEGMIRSLRNHPCLLVWVGGNENHMGWDFRYGTKPGVGNKLFDKIMPEAIARLDPDRHFHPSSPFGGRVPNWPLEGDWHDYSTLKFSPHAAVPLYGSEVGRASAPSLSSMRRFLSEEDLWPEGWDPAITTPGKKAWPPMWQYRSVGSAWDKVGKLEQYCEPRTAEELIRVLGTAHGDYLRDRVERERRGVPDGKPDGNRRCWGNMVWRLNDSWPIIYWAVIDYYLEPKIPYYYLRRSYDPILVSFEQTRDEIFVWVVNDSPEPVAGTLSVSRRTFGGDTRGRLTAEVELEPGQAKRCLSTTDFGPVVMRTEFLQANFAGREVTQL
ncbi:MAG: glycoside hydrolase family 2 protein, partial [Planctomycetota bacterium]